MTVSLVIPGTPEVVMIPAGIADLRVSPLGALR